MNFLRKNWSGILICLAIAIPSWILGKIFPVIGGAIIAIIAGMIVTMLWNDKGKAVITDYFMYDYNISCYCMDTAPIT